MKKNISLLLAIVFCFSFFTVTASADSADTGNTDSDFYISKVLSQNTIVMDEVFGDTVQDRLDEESSVQVSINPDKESVTITLLYKDTENTAVLSGTVDEIETTSGIGYVGVYEGFISPVQGRTLALNENGQLPLIADITFNDSDIWVVLTLGYATETMVPDILFYGDYSNQIADISNINATRSLEEAQLRQAIEHESVTTTAVDGTCKYQGYATVYLGSKMAGVLSVFHADELKNQGNMTTYVKVNTKSSLVENYVEDDLDYGSNALTAYPDTFNISLCGNNNDFHAVTNSYTPQNNTTSATISIPVYGGSVVGLQFVSYDVIMSSTTVTTSKYSSSSPHQNNKLSWEIYRRNGWNPDTFDGGYATETSMTVAATYTYEGNVTSNVTRSMTATGSIRYEYWIMIAGNMTSHHLTTGTMTKTTSVTICP